MLALYEEGVASIERAVRSWSSDRWMQDACGDWNGRDVAGHLQCVVGWYQAWLDRAEAGEAAPPFQAAELASQNDAALRGLDANDGPGRIEVFAHEARRYATRVLSGWDLPYGFPYGTITAGLHLGIAAGEWHLHAWDLSAGRHRPRDARELFQAVGVGWAAAHSGPLGWLGNSLVPLAARRRPWEQLLKRSGRRAV